MQWFGWLTKGHYEVSMLDRLIGLVEFAVVVGIGVLVAYGFEVRADKKRRHKRRHK